jgi:hypothetical protein
MGVHIPIAHIFYTKLQRPPLSQLDASRKHDSAFVLYPTKSGEALLILPALVLYAAI